MLGRTSMAMARDEIQHVIEKADAGMVLEPAFAVERQGELDLGLGRPSIDYGEPAPPSCPP